MHMTPDNEKPRVIVTRRLPAPIEARLGELFDVTFNRTDTPLTEAELIEAVGMADVLVPTVTDRIDASILSRAGSRLKLIANFGNGVDHIDLGVARKQGITVTNTPGVLTEDTADMTMALILVLPRRLLDGVRLMEKGEWTGWSPTGLLGHRVRGMKLGILGMGRIGQAVARRARAFGMEIHYHNRRQLPERVEQALGARYWDSLDQMLSRMDMVTVHCPHTPATYHLLSARRLSHLPKHAYIINTARGEVIDEAAMLQMLEAGDLAGAGLDVYEHEPVVSPRLLALPNVVALPHMGSATEEGRIAMGGKVLINIKTFIDGHAPPDRVLDEWL